MPEIVNTGLLSRPVGAKDYFAGGITGLPKEVVNPEADWRPYKSEPHEMQLRFGRDFLTCTNFAATDTVESILFKKFGIRFNAADRALAILSEQGPNGNYLTTVAEAIRKYGLVPEEMLPWTEEQDTFEKFMTITPEKRQEIIEAGAAWLREYDFGWEWVYDNYGPQMPEALEWSPIFAAGLYASESMRDDDGIYHTNFPGSPNTTHAFVLLHQTERGFKYIDDSYSVQQKKLAQDFRVPLGLRFHITKKNPNPMPLYYPPSNSKVVVVDTGERLMYVGGETIYKDDIGKIQGEVEDRNSEEVPGKPYRRANGYPIVHVHAADVAHLSRINLKGQPV